VETRQVQAGKDTILGIAERAKPVDAIAELVWNALDAEAINVDVAVSIREMGGPDQVVITDDGSGMTYETAADVFTVDGESWKKAQRFSPNINRPMHGHLGRGRFLAYAIADKVEWRTTVVVEGEPTTTRVIGARSRPNEYEFDGPTLSEERVGTVVTLNARQDQKAARLVDEAFLLPLTARLGPTLLALSDAKVTYRGLAVNPREHVEQDHRLELDVPDDQLHGHAPPELHVVVWSQDMKSREVFLCDEEGAVVTDLKVAGLPVAPIHWTAYVRWSGFRDPELMTVTDLHHPDVRHGQLIQAARFRLSEFLQEALDERRGHLIAEWKAEGVYPYPGEPATPTDEVEREIFDVVAVVASPAIGKDAKQKKLSLKLLQETVRSEPTKTRKILNAVIGLSDDEVGVLSELLERTHLGAIIQAADLVSNRIDFVRGLRHLLYSDQTKKVFREVDQLHPMLVNEPWIFGDEWLLSLSESGLTGVVKSTIGALGKDVVYAPTPVKLPSGKAGRVDMVFYRHLPESETTRHLVVELKRPMRISMTEYAQISNYVTAIIDHSEVIDTPNRWDFWLVGTELDGAVRNQLTDRSNPGLAVTGERHRLWVYTWGQLLDSADRRLEALSKELQLVATEATGLEYLRRQHAEFVPTQVMTGDTDGSEAPTSEE
jgi:hypothetical protein